MRKRCLSVSSLWYRNKRIDYDMLAIKDDAYSIVYEYKINALGYSSFDKERDIRL